MSLVEDLLPGFSKLISNRTEHTKGIEQARIIRIEQSDRLFKCPDLVEKFVIVNLKSLLLPLSATRFKNPQSHHILEEADCTKHAAFIGEVLLCDRRVDEGVRSLNPNQRPGAGRNVSPVCLDRSARNRAPR